MRRTFPLLSIPILATRLAFKPRELIFAATFAAPPGFIMSFSIFKTGTGASGDIRFVDPKIYLSSIASPITKILDCLNRLMIFYIHFLRMLNFL